MDDSFENEGGTEVIDEIDIEEPRKYNVILINDNYTPMDFVVWILINIFNKNQQESENIMRNVHEKGKGIAGTYTHEIAETKRAMVLSESRNNKHPLQCDMEEV